MLKVSLVTPEWWVWILAGDKNRQQQERIQGVLRSAEE